MADEYIERLKAVPILDVLREVYGIEAKQHGGRYYCKLREERTASCCIYPNNTWYDFGGSAGGDTINLIETLEHCSRKAAMEKLGALYHIERETARRDPSVLADYEWNALGIAPDMVSKNLDIHILEAPDAPRSSFADINLDLTNAGQLAAFQEKYYLPISEYRKKDPPGYHRLLRKKAFYPLMEEKDSYLAALHGLYTLMYESDQKEAFRFTVSDPEQKQAAAELNRKAQLLRRAVDDISMLRVPEFKLDPAHDLGDILSGRVGFQVSKLPYHTLCRYAKICGDSLSSVTIPYGLYAQKYYPVQSKLHGIPHYAAYRKGECTVYCMDRYLPQLHAVFEGEILSEQRYFKAYAHEKRREKTQSPPQNRV